MFFVPPIPSIDFDVSTGKIQSTGPSFWAASIDSLVSEANDGDTVTIYAFDRDVRLHSSMTIDATARNDLNDFVHSLEAEGNRTHLGRDCG